MVDDTSTHYAAVNVNPHPSQCSPGTMQGSMGLLTHNHDLDKQGILNNYWMRFS